MASTGVLESGGAYDLSARVKLSSGTEGSTSIRITVEEFPADGSRSVVAEIGTAPVASAEWVEVGGLYALMEGIASANVYITADSIGDVQPSFLVDDVLMVTATAPQLPPVPPGVVPGGAIDPVGAPVSLAMGSGNVAALTFDDGPNSGTPLCCSTSSLRTTSRQCSASSVRT